MPRCDEIDKRTARERFYCIENNPSRADQRCRVVMNLQGGVGAGAARREGGRGSCHALDVP
jgi:hypothetical protein